MICKRVSGVTKQLYRRRDYCLHLSNWRGQVRITLSCRKDEPMASPALLAVAEAARKLEDAKWADED